MAQWLDDDSLLLCWTEVDDVSTCVGSVVGGPGDEWRWCSLSVAGQGQRLSFVEGHITWQFLEGRPHVDGQAEVLSHGSSCIGGHACEHASIPWLCDATN